MVVVMIMTMVMIKIDENYPILEANKAKMKIPKNAKRFIQIAGHKSFNTNRHNHYHYHRPLSSPFIEIIIGNPPQSLPSNQCP